MSKWHHRLPSWQPAAAKRFRAWMLAHESEIDELRFHGQLLAAFAEAGGAPLDFRRWLEFVSALPRWDTFSWGERMRMAWMAGEMSVREPGNFEAGITAPHS